MARIRTIKPETPQSESLGRCSRDARLCFIMLWTQADDAGRLRGNSRMLASLLFPYDDAAPGLIDGWLDELDREGCIRRFAINGNAYIDIPNWLEHQKIDKPSKSKIPPFNESSRTVAKPRECSSLDQGREGTKEGKGEEGNGAPSALGADAPPPAQPSDDDSGFDLPANLDVRPEGEAVRLWNAMAVRLGLPTVQRLSRPREAALRQRLAQCGGLGGWRAALEKVEASAFLSGRARRGKGHENWRCTFDFVVKDGNFTKLMEGNFDDGNPQAPTNGFAAIVAENIARPGADDRGPGELRPDG